MIGFIPIADVQPEQHKMDTNTNFKCPKQCTDTMPFYCTEQYCNFCENILNGNSVNYSQDGEWYECVLCCVCCPFIPLMCVYDAITYPIRIFNECCCEQQQPNNIVFQ